MKNKAERRIAFLDYIEEGDLVIAIVFRGCWIDAITMKKGLKSFEGVISWLKEEGYFYEISGFHLSDSILEKLGLRDFASAPCCERNLSSAKIIIDGIKNWLNTFINASR